MFVAASPHASKGTLVRTPATERGRPRPPLVRTACVGTRTPSSAVRTACVSGRSGVRCGSPHAVRALLSEPGAAATGFLPIRVFVAIPFRRPCDCRYLKSNTLRHAGVNRESWRIPVFYCLAAKPASLKPRCLFRSTRNGTSGTRWNKHRRFCVFWQKRWACPLAELGLALWQCGRAVPDRPAAY